MIFHKKGSDIELEYIFVCYKRLYYESCDKNANRAEFDNIFLTAYHDVIINHKASRIEVEYEKYYSPSKVQSELLDKILDEPYITQDQKTGKLILHYLKKHDKQRIRNTVLLGISPMSSFTGFCRNNPNFAIYENDYGDDIHEYYADEPD